MSEETLSVVCRELNCGRTGSESTSRARVESSPNWLDQVKCRKHDTTLWHCPSEPWGNNSSERSCSGRLEVYHNAVWGSICDDQWDIRDAEVVCRQLGCGKALRADGSAAFGAGEGVIWLNRVKCRGDEIHLWDCSYSLKNHTDCSHKENAGVTCAGQRILLVNGGSRCAARVEVLHEGQWGTVCSDDWDMSDAAVVCRELGCGEAEAAVRDAHFGPGSGPVLKGFTHCNGSDEYIGDNEYKDAGVICSDSVRLVNGGSRCAGRVEVLHEGQWGTVCSDGWDMRDAAVVCRELGCGEAEAAVHNAHFGPGSGPVLKGYANCGGSESTLNECFIGHNNYYCGSHAGDAGVICSGRLQLILIFTPPSQKVSLVSNIKFRYLNCLDPSVLLFI
uniref:SRCR domain-containing protein n=1 Tax=Electrophorus electricus TaxID=8005 RepID=A0A4W4DN48_ELEEL